MSFALDSQDNRLPISKKTAPSSLTIIGGERAVLLTIEYLL